MAGELKESRVIIVASVQIKYIVKMDNLDAPVTWPNGTQGAWLAGFIKGITKHCCTQQNL